MADLDSALRAMEPENLDLEQFVLGGLMYAPDAVPAVRDILQAIHFYQPLHQRIYGAILTLVDRGRQPTPITVRDLMRADDAAYHDAGGDSYLMGLVARGCTAAEAENFARGLIDLHARRSLMSAGMRIIYRATDMEDTAEAQAAAAGDDLRLAVEDMPQTEQLVTMDDALTRLRGQRDEIREGRAGTVVPIGLQDVDRALSARPGRLIIIAGRPGMGKSALMLHWAAHAASLGIGSLIASLEMEAEEIMPRLIAMGASERYNYVSYKAIADGALTEAEPRVGAAWEAQRRLPLIINDRPPLTVQRIESSARNAARLFERRDGVPLGAIFVDYLQLVKPGVRRNSRYEEITEISNDLKALAKRMRVPVIAAAQINREVEKRDNKRPTMSDLRDSGAIEQDADVILFPYRPAKYDDDASPNVCELIVAKNRHGPADLNIRVRCEIGSNFFFDDGA